MSMWISCLVLLVLMSVLSWLEWQWVAARNLPLAGLLGPVLGISIAFAISGLEGVLKAFFRLRSSGTDRSSWKPGSVVFTSGRIQSRTGPVQTPIGRQNAVAYSYTWTAYPRGGDSENPGQSIAGLHMGQLELLTPHGSIRLEGFPSLEHFPSTALEGKRGYPAAADWLAGRDWEPRDISFNPQQRPQVVPLILQGIAPNKLPLDLMHSSLVDALFRRGKSAEIVREGLDQWSWEFEERYIPTGSEVTVKGRYSENPPTIQVQSSLLSFDSELRPGQASSNARKELRTYSLSLLFNALFAIGIHYDIYWNDATVYRKIIRFFANLEE